MKKTYQIFLLLIMLLPQFSFAEGGGAGNGGDGVFCPWRKPMVLDYYASGFLGGVGYGHWGPIIDIYKTADGMGNEALKIFKKASMDLGPRVKINHISSRDVERIYKGLKKSLKRIGDTSKWKKVDNVPVIKDTLSEDFLPNGCKILQVARVFGSKVSVDRDLFEQLDQKQKEMLILHEAIYLLGREVYGHQNSYLTRNLVRAILRYTSPRDFEIFESIRKFIHNENPVTKNEIDEEIPGSNKLNTWRLNIFDMHGEFVLKGSLDNGHCPRRILVDVSNDLTFKVPALNFSTSQGMKISLLLAHMGGIVPSVDQNDLSELGMSERDRAIFIDNAILENENYTLRYFGLNRKDEFYLKQDYPKNKPTCWYARKLP